MVVFQSSIALFLIRVRRRAWQRERGHICEMPHRNPLHEMPVDEKRHELESPMSELPVEGHVVESGRGAIASDPGRWSWAKVPEILFRFHDQQ